MFKFLYLSVALLSTVSAFQAASSVAKRSSLMAALNNNNDPQHAIETSRQDFLKASSLAAATWLVLPAAPAFARGRATLEKSYERYAPRIRAGGEFYAKDLRQCKSFMGL